jgi:hypothetical protein
MHTYLRYEDGTYTVGMWQPNHEGRTAFWKLFDVGDMFDAITAVNTLNGGDRDYFKVTKEH